MNYHCNASDWVISASILGSSVLPLLLAVQSAGDAEVHVVAQQGAGVGRDGVRGAVVQDDHVAGAGRDLAVTPLQSQAGQPLHAATTGQSRTEDSRAEQRTAGQSKSSELSWSCSYALTYACAIECERGDKVLQYSVT
jgi:hypothetical protein